MKAALADAGIEPRQVGFLNTHGTGTPHNDEAEARACARLLEERLSQVPVTATKAAVGHLLGAAGALEAVATVLALMEGAVHPTPGGGEMDAELGLDLVVGEARELENGAVAISTNLAFGGANAALVLRAWSGETA
jgi:3-oxoacyl-[acyl-carrier-protein] synthase II